MKNIGKLSLAAVAALLALGQLAEARKPEVSHADIVVVKGQTLEGDVATDKSVLVDGRLDGSATAIGGGSVTINGELTGDLVSMGGPVAIPGLVKGDVSSIGGPVDVSGHVEGDISAVGGKVTLSGQAQVDGDISALGGKVEKGPQAKLKGDINSFSGDALRGTISNAMGIARNAGRYNWGDRREQHRGFNFNLSGNNSHDMWTVAGLLGIGIAIVFSILLTGLVLLLIPAIFFPKQVETARAALTADIWKACAIGAIAVVGFFPGLLMMVVSILGIPLVPFALMLYAAAAVLGLSAFSVILQGRFFEGLKKTGPSGLLGKVAVGYALMAGLLFFGKLIPFIGGLMSLIGMILLAFGVMTGLGAAWMTRMGTRVYIPEPAVPPAVPPAPAPAPASQPPAAQPPQQPAQ
jgi:cytoskeletal protein CcmA (bactofilin family)